MQQAPVGAGKAEKGRPYRLKGFSLSFFSKVFLSAVALVLLCTAAISGIIYSRMDAVLSGQNEELMRYSTSQIRISVENILGGIEAMANGVYSDNTVWELLQEGTYTNDYIRFQKNLYVENMLQNLSNGNDYIKSVAIYNCNENSAQISKYFRNAKDFQRRDLLDAAIAAGGRSIWETYADDTGAMRILLLKHINIYRPGGVLVVEMDTAALSGLYDIYNPRENVLFILNGEHTVISSNDAGMLGKPAPADIQKSIEGGELFSKTQYTDGSYYTHFEAIKGIWTVVMLYSAGGVESQKTAMGRYILICAAAFMALGLLFSLAFSRRFGAKLDRLVYKMKLIENGTMDITPDAGGMDEFSALDHTLCAMAGRVDTLTNEIIRAEKIKVDTEIRYLQMQMNPHFLYNLLSAARWMAVQNSQDSIVFIIDHLCNFYRLALSKGSEVIKLKTEISLVESYVALQNLCFADGIRLTVDVDRGLENMDICKMTLQPFVENSVLHGKAHGRTLNISVSAGIFEDGIRFAVEDDGYGMPEEVIEYVNGLNGGERAPDRYFGIANTFTRVSLFSGGRARIRAKNKAQGAVVELFLPR
jgi:two-component system sensor histidine kinase YesM